MKFFRLLKTDLYRAVAHTDFWAAALLFGALCFTAEGCVDAGRSITVLELALSCPAEQIKSRFLLSGSTCSWPGSAPIT